MYEQIEANKRNSFILMFLFFLFLIGMGAVFSKLLFENFWFSFILFAVIFTIITLVQYYYGDKEVLALSGAKEVTRKQFPVYGSAVEGLTIAAGIPVPKMYIIESNAMNAFATGRDPEHASIAITTGLLERLNKSELEGVVAHELSHIKNFDIRMMLFAAVMAGMITMIANMFSRMLWFGGQRGDKKSGALMLIGILFAILAPIGAALIKLAISRQREYLADADGALLTRYPQGLASALKKIGGDREVLQTANTATAHLFISNPIKNSFEGLFSTHPPIADRIKRLESM